MIRCDGPADLARRSPPERAEALEASPGLVQLRLGDFSMALAPAEHDARRKGRLRLGARPEGVEQGLRAGGVIMRSQNILQP